MRETVEKIRVENVESLLKSNLKIPYYQRPYRWHAKKHVKQLLQDLSREASIPENEYRLGTVLIHHNNSDLDVVDGQQRLVTLSLILYALDSELKGILENEFKHIDSKNNIKYNYIYIQRYVNNKSETEKDRLKSFILENCNLLVITVTKLGEAFQLFDSQNARGKTLGPADLLKAFHLREMEQVYEAEKHRLVNQWETAIDNKQLTDVLGNYLFRLRQWDKKEKKYFFDKDETDAFKGVNPYRMIREGKNYPYVQQLMAQSSSNFYQYYQTIINGKWFFQYVNHYLDKVERIEEICREDNEDLQLNYNGHYRIGDSRLIKLYKNLLLIYLDKFGEDTHFKTYKKLAYRWVFATRIEKKQIRFETILNKMVNDDNPIFWLSEWFTPQIDMMQMKVESIVRFKDLKIEDDSKKIRKRREFSKGGLYDILLQLENKTNTNE